MSGADPNEMVRKNISHIKKRRRQISRMLKDMENDGVEVVRGELDAESASSADPGTSTRIDPLETLRDK